LMFWWPALWLAGDLPAAFPDSRLASTIGVALFVMGAIAFAQMALSYPTGRLVASMGLARFGPPACPSLLPVPAG